jgi:hypothetical protein
MILEARVERSLLGFGMYKGQPQIPMRILKQVRFLSPFLLLLGNKLFLALRIEWCKARARAHRWQEECLLLAEEMRRVLAFFSWQAEDWKRTAREVENQLPTSSETIEVVAAAEIGAKSIVREGKIAYAHRQGNLRKKMKLYCENEWVGLCAELQHMEGGDATVMVEHQCTT